MRVQRRCAGTEPPKPQRKKLIDANLEHAKIILLLVSTDFIASDYYWEIEMKRVLERHEKGEARVIPVIIREAKWDTAPFAKLQALPEKGKAVDLWQIHLPPHYTRCSHRRRRSESVIQITPSSASAAISWDDIPSNSPYT
jgi:hypothetical protein